MQSNIYNVQCVGLLARGSKLDAIHQSRGQTRTDLWVALNRSYDHGASGLCVRCPTSSISPHGKSAFTEMGISAVNVCASPFIIILRPEQASGHSIKRAGHSSAFPRCNAQPLWFSLPRSSMELRQGPPPDTLKYLQLPGVTHSVI